MAGAAYSGGVGKALIIVVVVVLSVYSLFDVIAQPRTRVRLLPKLVWVLVVLIPVLGPIAWLAIGRPPFSRPSGSSRKPRVVGPDDDPDFLWRIERRKRPRKGSDGDPGEQPTG